MSQTHQNDLAIYMPQARGMYREGRGSGGAERQTYLLARALSDAGLRVAHVVLPVGEDFSGSPHPRLAVVQRAPQGSLTVEPRRVWQALATADAQTYVLRTATPALAVAGLFCRGHGRRLIFSSANDGDFTFETVAPRSVALFKLGMRLVDAIVVQSSRQLELARSVFPRVSRVTEIASFVDAPRPAQPMHPQAFLWIGRLVEYKQPLRYLELARALPDVRFWMLGVQSYTAPTLAHAVRDCAAKLSNVELLEPRSHDATMQLMGAAVALVNTSRFEGMPNVFLEAWAQGVPVISLDCDPDQRIAMNGLGVAAEGSWERFLAGTRQLWTQRDDRAHYRTAAARYLADRHSTSAVTFEWMRVIDSVQ